MLDNRLSRWVLQTADVRCKSYIFFTTIGSFISRAVQFGRPPFFSDKSNFINQVFVKQCWLWTVILISTLCVLRKVWDNTSMRRVYLVLLRLLFGTTFWYTSTSIIDGLRDNVGVCSSQEFSSRQLCETEGSTWKYMLDISGHMFMMVFCNLFIAKHLDEVNEENREGPQSVPLVITQTLCRVLVGLFDVMMVCTILYWHSPPEKILGTLTGVLGYVLLFKKLSQLIPSLR